MNTALSELYNENNKRYTHTHVLEIMKAIQKCKLSIADNDAYTIAQPNELQLKIHNMVIGSDCSRAFES
jgi:hypothetical protein